MLDVTVSAREDCRVITVQGELTIRQVTEFREKLLDAMAAGGAIRFDLRQVTAMDLAAVQVFAAARKTAGARIAMVEGCDCPDAVRGAFAAAALEALLNRMTGKDVANG